MPATGVSKTMQQVFLFLLFNVKLWYACFVFSNLQVFETLQIYYYVTNPYYTYKVLETLQEPRLI